MRRYLPTPALPTPKTTFNSKNLKNLPQFLFQTLSFLLGILFLAAPVALHGQTGGASLTGRINDASGAVLQNADVAITNTATKVQLQTKSNKSGVYSFPNLNPGNYVMRVEKKGFRSEDLVGLTVYTNDNLEKNFVLQVGAVSESVTVRGGATSASPGVSLTVDREFIESTPLNGQSLQDLIQLAPGAVSDQAGYYTIDGQRTDSNNYTVDGVSANLGGIYNSPVSYGAGLSGSAPSQTILGTTQSLASVDDLEEFKVQTSGYTAEYGRNPGGQVQFTTRSGTNDVHGGAFDYLRNTLFDANSYSNDLYGNPKTAEHQNDFGATLGGPVVIPRLYDGKNKTFYFASYEGLRLLIPNTETESVPTQALRNWSSRAVQPYLDTAPLSKLPGNQDGCTIPDPTTGLMTACDAMFSDGFSSPENLNSVSIRLDQNFGNKIHAFVRYADTPSTLQYGLESPGNERDSTHGVTVGLTANLKNNIVADVHFNDTHDGEGVVNTERAVDGSVPLSRSLLVPPAYDGPYAGGLASIYIPGVNLGIEAYLDSSGSVVDQDQFLGSLSWIRAAHTLKFGADWRRISSLASSGSYSSFIQVESLHSLQEGNADSVQISASNPGEPIFDNLSLFAQDHVKMSSRLTLDYGLRWEFNPPPGPSNGKYPVVLTSDDLATAALAPLGTKPYKTYYDHFAPRVGLAWNAYPSVTHALTVRGGVGIFFDTGQQEIGNAYLNSYPFEVSGATIANVSFPLPTSSLMPPSLNIPIVAPYPYLNSLQSPKLTLPYSEQWNFSIDEAINTKNTLTASYVGNNGKRLLFTNYYGSVAGNPKFTSLEFTNNSSSSNYNALQVQDVGRLATGLDAVASFTWAHALDNASNDYSNVLPVWGNSDYDVRRILNLALNYHLPSASFHPLLKAVTNGWTLNNRLTTQGGYPINLYQAEVLTPSGTQEYYYPNLIQHVPIYLHGTASQVGGEAVPGSWRLNSAAFSAVPADPNTGYPIAQGDLGRNYVRNPPFYALNTSVQRSFPIYDRTKLNCRLDAFNILNHPNLAGPDVTITDATFGELIYGGTEAIGAAGNSLYAMGAPRSLQLSIKVQF